MCAAPCNTRLREVAVAEAAEPANSRVCPHVATREARVLGAAPSPALQRGHCQRLRRVAAHKHRHVVALNAVRKAPLEAFVQYLVCNEVYLRGSEDAASQRVRRSARSAAALGARVQHSAASAPGWSCQAQRACTARVRAGRVRATRLGAPGVAPRRRPARPPCVAACEMRFDFAFAGYVPAGVGGA